MLTNTSKLQYFGTAGQLAFHTYHGACCKAKVIISKFFKQFVFDIAYCMQAFLWYADCILDAFLLFLYNF